MYNVASLRPFQTRIGRLGHVEDPKTAIMHKAVDLTPDGYPDKPAYLNNLGSTFETRLHRLNHVEDLGIAIPHKQSVVDSTPDRHPERQGHLSNLGSAYTNLCGQDQSHCGEKPKTPAIGNMNYADSRNSRLFTRAITHQAFSEEFSIFGTTSPHSISLSSVFQPTQDSIFSPTPSVPNKFKGHIELHPNSDISLHFNIHSNSTPICPLSVAQLPAKIPCEITVHFPQDKRQLSTNSIPNDEPTFLINSEETKSTANRNPDALVQASAPSIPPSPTPSSYFHHSLGLVFSDDTELQGFIAQHFQPNEAIREVAFDLYRAGWLISNEKEPPLSADEIVVRRGLLPEGAYFSRFELFFDRNAKHRCHWMEGNERCTHEASRKDRAIGHAHFHFNYKPFTCVGDCGKSNCQQRFTCATVLKEHIGNRKRTQACEICQRVVNAQNMKRHMKRHDRR